MGNVIFSVSFINRLEKEGGGKRGEKKPFGPPSLRLRALGGKREKETGRLYLTKERIYLLTVAADWGKEKEVGERKRKRVKGGRTATPYDGSEGSAFFVAGRKGGRGKEEKKKKGGMAGEAALHPKKKITYRPPVLALKRREEERKKKRKRGS